MRDRSSSTFSSLAQSGCTSRQCLGAKNYVSLSFCSKVPTLFCTNIMFSIFGNGDRPLVTFFFQFTSFCRHVFLQLDRVSSTSSGRVSTSLIPTFCRRSMSRNPRAPKRSPTPTSATFPDMPPPPVPSSPGSPSPSKPLYLCSPFVEAALVKGNFKTIVVLPKYVDIMEWVAVNGPSLLLTLWPPS